MRWGCCVMHWWGVRSCRGGLGGVDHVGGGVGWVMQGCSGSCRGGMDHVGMG